MRTIGFINWKGGVGKTTISINVAYALAEKFGELKILFIDTDKQANASSWFHADPEMPTLTDLLAKEAAIEEVIQHTRYKNIDLIAADSELLDINIEILKDGTGRQDTILREALKPVRAHYDICIIDNPPDSNIPVLNGLSIADDLICVTLPNRFSILGIYQLQKELDNYQQALGLDVPIRGVVFNQYNPEASMLAEELGQKYCLMPFIGRGRATQKWLDCVINEQKSIYEISPNSAYAKDIYRFTEELMDLIEAARTEKVQ